MKRLLQNLLANTLRCSEGALAVSLRQESGRCVLSFRNAARTLDGRDVSRLMERFYTADPARPSAGMGLSIVKGLAEKMRGTVQCAYETPWLTVTVCFPATSSESG